MAVRIAVGLIHSAEYTSVRQEKIGFGLVGIISGGLFVVHPRCQELGNIGIGQTKRISY